MPEPQARVKPRGGLSPVWLIPLIALLIGGWLAAKAVLERGPIIQIELKSAAGLQAGQTKVRFKEVEIGQVTAIDVAPRRTSVIVTAELKRGTEDLLTEETRFWVQRPRVTASGISGLETLLSGAYLAIDPMPGGAAAREFTALAEPPLYTSADSGTRFRLNAPALGSLSIGAPVYFRQIQVGQVAGFSLDPQGRGVGIDLFIFAPHDRLVTTATRFWSVSGIDLAFGVDGLRLDTQSLMAVLIGGVELDTPASLDAPGVSPPADHVFVLYANREQAHEKQYPTKERYLLYFDGSVRGLSVGAPVMLRGIRIGQVLDIQLQLDVEDLQFHIPVLIEIEPERIAVRGDADRLGAAGMVEGLVGQGLRGQLKSGSLLTGQLYVELDVHPGAPPASLHEQGDFMVLPTVPGSLEAATGQVTALLDRLADFPLDQIGTDLLALLAGTNALIRSPGLTEGLVELDQTLAALRRLAEQLGTQVVPELTAALGETTGSLRGARQFIDEGAPLTEELRRTLQEITAAARSLRIFADYLERHPEALLKGKGAVR